MTACTGFSSGRSARHHSERYTLNASAISPQTYNGGAPVSAAVAVVPATTSPRHARNQAESNQLLPPPSEITRDAPWPLTATVLCSSNPNYPTLATSSYSAERGYRLHKSLTYSGHPRAFFPPNKAWDWDQKYGEDRKMIKVLKCDKKSDSKRLRVTVTGRIAYNLCAEIRKLRVKILLPTPPVSARFQTFNPVRMICQSAYRRDDIGL